MSRFSIFLIVSALTFAGCKKNAPEVMAEVDESSSSMVATMPNPTVPEGRDAAVVTLRDNFRRVHFDTDSDAINAVSQEALVANADILSRYRGLIVEVQGHADERGTTDYNLALGQRRSTAVQQFLLSNGVNPEQLRTISYGEERPEAEGNDDTAWTANRRAEFRVIVPQAVVRGTVQ